MVTGQQDSSEFCIDILRNGLRLVTVPVPHLHSLELVCYIGVGSRCENPQQAGISHLLEHMLFRGSSDYPTSLALEQAFEAIGGAVNAATDMESTCFHSRLHPDRLAEGVALFASMLRRPKFDGLAIEKRIVLEETLEDYNEAGDQVNSDNLMVALAWPDHPLGNPLVGSPKTLAAINREQLEAYYRCWYQPANLVICASGPLERDNFISAVEREFGDWTNVPVPSLSAAPPVKETGPEVCWVRDSSSQVSLQMAFPLPGRNAPGTLALRLLRRILAWGGSARLTRRLREELGLTYAVDAGCSLLADTGYLAIELAIAPDNLYQVITEMLSVLDTLCRTPVSDAELTAAVRSYLFDLEFTRDQNEALAMRYGWGLQADYLRTVEQDCRELQQLNADDLQQSARSVFRQAALKLVVVGPWKDADRAAVEQLLGAFRAAG